MLNNLRIGAKLGLNSIILITAILAISIISIYTLFTIRNDVSTVFDEDYEKVMIISPVFDEIFNIIAVWYATSLTNDPLQIAEYRHSVTTSLEHIDLGVAELEKLVRSPEEIRLLNNFKQATKDFDAFNIKMDGYLAANDKAAFIDFMRDEFKQVSDDYLDVISELEVYNLEKVEALGDNISSFVALTISVLSILILVGLVLSISFGYIITRSITNPITKCMDIAKNLADGNTEIEIEVKSKDEIGMLTQTMKMMVNSIKDMYHDTISLSE